MGHAHSRLRITVWPDTQITIPAVQHIEAKLAVELPDVIDIRELLGRGELPPEFFLRELFDLPLDNAALASAFATFGPLSPWGDEALSVMPKGHVADSEFPVLQRSAQGAAHPMTSVHAEVVRLHVRAARALVDQWFAYESDDKPSALVAAWPDQGFRKPKSAAEAWSWWQDHVNAALRPFHTTVDTGHGFLPAPPTAYSCAVLQLVNHINEGLPIRRCANERCQQRFRRQQGRALKGRSRSVGVLFCSSSCARAQANREYRRRQRAATEARKS
jgi:hypothetical protein